jgi:hypothetical protein
MKPHITPDQFNELSEASKLYLWNWWKPLSTDIAFFKKNKKEYEVFVVNRPYTGAFYFTGQNAKKLRHYIGAMQFEHLTVYPLLSITQMIEFIQDHNDKEDITITYCGEDWEIRSEKLGINILGVEPCDVLWEACELILKTVK